MASVLAVYFLRQDSRRVAEVEITNLSILLAEHAQGAAEATDHVLSMIAEELGKSKSSKSSNSLKQPFAQPFALHKYLQHHLRSLGYASSLNLDDAQGRLVASSLVGPTPELYSGDQDYFQIHKTSSSDRFYIDHPVQGPPSGAWTIRTSRRISGPAGEFLGVVSAGLDIERFRTFYASLHLGTGDTVLLLQADGTVMATFPANEALIGKPAPTAVISRIDRRDQPVHTPAAVQGPDARDDAHALVSVKRVNKYPLAIALIKSEASIQAPWQQRVWVTFSAAAILATTGLMLMLWFAKHLRRELALDSSLHGAENSYLALTKQQLAGVAKIDVSTGLFLAVNAQFCAMTGYSEQELLGKTNYDITYPDDQQGAWQRLAAALTGTEDASPTCRKRYVRKDGSILHAVIGFNIIKNPETDATECIGLVQDITTFVEQQQHLQDEETRLSIIIQNSMDAIIVFNDEERIQIFNAAAEQMFGYSARDIPTLSLSSLIPPAQRTVHQMHVQDFLYSGNTARKIGSHMMVQGLRANGVVFPIEASISRVSSGGRIYMTVIIRDLTEQVKAQKELNRAQMELRELLIASQTAREEEKSRISRELHDELGQSLTALKMDLSWLQSSASTDEDARTERMLGMQSILDSTVTATRRIASDLRPLMLDDLGLLAALEWLSQNFTRRTSVPCDLAVDNAVADVDISIQSALYRAVQECLTNISRHAQATLVKIELKVQPAVVQLRVHDNGKGILDLDRFKRGSYGLIGMRERIYILGGSVTIESPPGEGTLVAIVLPHVPSTQDITFIK